MGENAPIAVAARREACSEGAGVRRYWAATAGDLFAGAGLRTRAAVLAGDQSRARRRDPGMSLCPRTSHVAVAALGEQADAPSEAGTVWQSRRWRWHAKVI